MSYHEVLKQELKRDITGLKPKREIDQIKHAIEAIHTNLYVSEVEIIFDGYTVDLEGTRCMFDYASRDALIIKQRDDLCNKQNDSNEDESGYNT